MRVPKSHGKGCGRLTWPCCKYPVEPRRLAQPWTDRILWVENMVFIPDCVGRQLSTCASPLLRGALLAGMLGQRCGIHSTLSGDVGTFLNLRGERTPKGRPVRAAKSSTTPPQTHNCGCRRVPKGSPKSLKGFSGIFGDLSGPFGNPSAPFGDSPATLLCFFAIIFPNINRTFASQFAQQLPQMAGSRPLS